MRRVRSGGASTGNSVSRKTCRKVREHHEESSYFSNYFNRRSGDCVPNLKTATAPHLPAVRRRDCRNRSLHPSYRENVEHLRGRTALYAGSDGAEKEAAGYGCRSHESCTMRETLLAYCLRTGKTHLLEEWADDRNGDLDSVTAASGKRVWWQCANGHTWQTAVYARTKQDAGCPYCSNHFVWQGFNDLASQEPGIAAEWYQPLNGNKTPEQPL